MTGDYERFGIMKFTIRERFQNAALMLSAMPRLAMLIVAMMIKYLLLSINDALRRPEV